MERAIMLESPDRFLRLSDASAKKGSTTGTKTLWAVRLCRFHREPARRELIAELECIGVEKSYSVDLASTPIELTNPPEGFNVPDQRLRNLVFLSVNQYSPVIS